MAKTIFLDLNVRLDSIEPEDIMTVSDAKAIKQSLWRLLCTREGEIPYYRGYGLDLEQFCQAPMNKGTAQRIHEYILGKVHTYETRASLASPPKIVADINTGYMSFTYRFYGVSTSEIIELPPLQVYLGS